MNKLFSFVASKPRLMTLFAFVTLLLGAALFAGVNTGTQARDCDANAIMYCGAYSDKEFKDKLRANKPGDLHHIYRHYGVNTNLSLSHMSSGVVTPRGEVIVNNKVVAKNAYTVGRQDKPNSKKVTINGRTYFERANAQNLKRNFDVFVIFDAYGRFVRAIIKDCGNPVVAVPTQPLPSVECTGLTAVRVSDRRYQFTVSHNSRHGGAVQAVHYTYGDGKSETHKDLRREHTYAQPGTYTIRATLKTNLGDRTSDKCVVKITIPDAACKALDVSVADRTAVTLRGAAITAGGAGVTGYLYEIRDENNDVVFNQTVNTTELTHTLQTAITEAGAYTAKLTVKTTEGDKTAPRCEAAFTIKEEPKPGISINKKVDGVDRKQVDVGQEFIYQLVVQNTGNTALENVKVTDDAPANIQFISADEGTIENNKWSHTIPTLEKGESVTFQIKAKVTTYVATDIKNTACVDAPSIPGTPDDCDDAYVYVPPTPPTPVTPTTPTELPTTGIGSGIATVIGLSSLTISAAYYIASRRKLSAL